MAGSKKSNIGEKTTSSTSFDALLSFFIDKKNIENSLVKLSFSAVMFVMTIVWIQYASPANNNVISETISLEIPSNQLSVLSHPFKSSFQKTSTGSTDDPVRLNPKIKDLTRIGESHVKTEAKDESTHSRNYTNSNTSELIHREAVDQRTGTFSTSTNKVVEDLENKPFVVLVEPNDGWKEEVSGKIIYHSGSSDLYQSESSELNTSLSIVTQPTKIVETKTTAFEKSELTTLTMTSLKLSSVAVRAEEAPIYSDDDASLTKNENQPYELKVDESEAVASVSLTDNEPMETIPVEKVTANNATSDYEITSTKFLNLQQQAFDQGKILMVRFTADWCIPCKIMEQNVYSNAKVKDAITKDFISLKLDSDSFDGINLKQLYKVQRIPTVLFFDSEGDLLAQYPKSMTSTAMLSILNDFQTKSIEVVNDSLLTLSENDIEVIEASYTPIAK